MKIILLFLAIFSIENAFAQNQLIARGNQFYKAGQFEQAEINYRKALEADPENETALFNLAAALHRQGKFDDAAKVNGGLTRITKDQTLKSAAFYNQGVSNSSSRQLEASIASYKQALKINPNDQQARENLQKALMQRKKQQQQKQQQKQSSSMSQKQADQKLRQLQQRERELQQKLNQKNQGGGGAQDW